jgi:hypothetical protein
VPVPLAAPTKASAAVVASTAPGPAASAAGEPLRSAASSAEISVLTTIAQISATALSVIGGLLVALATFLLSSRASIESKILEVGQSIRSEPTATSQTHVMNLAQEFNVLQRYRYEYPQFSFDELVEKLYFDLNAENSFNPKIPLGSLITFKDPRPPCFDAMQCRLVRLTYDDLDPSREDRDYGSVNFQTPWKGVRAYRKSLFPNGLGLVCDWLRSFERFEMIASHAEVARYRIAPRMHSLFADHHDPQARALAQPPAAYEQWLVQIGSLARSMSPFASHLASLLRDRDRVNNALKFVASSKLRNSLLFAGVVGVLVPVVFAVAGSEKFSIWTGVTVVLLLSTVAVFWLVGRQLKGFAPENDQNLDIISKLGMLQEQVKLQEHSDDLVFNLELPVTGVALREAGFESVAAAVESYLALANDVYEPGLQVLKRLEEEFVNSKLSVDYAIPPDAGGQIVTAVKFLNVQRLAESLPHPAMRDPMIHVVAPMFGKVLYPLAKFRWPVDPAERADVVGRLAAIAQCMTTEGFVALEPRIAAAAEARANLIKAVVEALTA